MPVRAPFRDPVRAGLRRRFAPGLPIVLALAAGPVPAADGMPTRKPGLWELSMQTTNAPSQLIRQCIDAQTDARMQRLAQGAGSQQCTRNLYRRDGDRYIGESECRIGASVATTRAVFAGDFDKAYRGEVDARYSPPLAGVSQSKVTIAARWIGPCPAGWKPGDMEMPGMGRMNVSEMMAGRPPEKAK